LICPETEFSPFNSALHSIRAKDVEQKPTWPEVYPEFLSWASSGVLVSHTFFDLRAVERACQRYGMAMLHYAKWVDSCGAARKAWPQLANHKLPTLARHFGIVYRAHDAAEDARVAGEIYLLTMQTGGRIAQGSR
jgi:DNA polymerase-3 subunit epsilon